MKYLRNALVLLVLNFAAAALADDTITYTYDALGRVTNVVRSGASTANTTYTLDPAGNRTNVTVTGAGTGTPSFSINSVSVSEGGTATFTVTRSGNASETLVVSYTAADGSAVAGSDYDVVPPGTLTFLASEPNTKTIEVATINDAAVEPAETFTITLSGNSPGSTIGTGTGTATINDNDVAPSFAISDAPAVTEGGNLVYTVTKTGAGAADVTFATANGTATATSDYTSDSNTLVFASGDTTKTITVTTVDDSTVEPAETVLVNLSAATNGATISDAQGSGTINDNDVAPSFAISDAPAVTEGGDLVYTVTKTGTGAADVAFATANGTATATSDYLSNSNTLMFASGDTTKTITVTTVDDSTVESAETVLVNLSAATNGATISDAQGSGTINDNDASFAISDAPTVTEGGNLVYTVTKTGGVAADVTFATADGTAVATEDYTSDSNTLVFAAGDTTKTITVATVDDATVEAAETVLVNLSGATNGPTISDAQGSGTINDNDVAPSFAISDAPAVTEGGALVYTVTKTGSGAANVAFATANGTATAGSDYNSNSNTLVFASADTTKTITVTTIDDSAVESAETVLVNLSGATGGATISDAQGSGTINDNDVAPSFAISDATSVIEGGSLVYTVTKTGTGAANVAFATANGTATAGSDYTSTSGTLVFASGDTTKTITVTTSDDATLESAESVLVNLSGATGGATISDAQGSGTIIDNDGTTIAINDRQYEEGGYLTFTVTRSGPGTAFSVNYATSNLTATAGSDYTATSGTLTFTSGQTTKTFVVYTANDSAAEADETFAVTLSGATKGVVITDASGVGTILDDDSTSIEIFDQSYSEGGFLTFNVNRTGPGVAFSVDYATVNGTAVAGSDYTAESGTLSFTSNNTSKSFQVDTTEDQINEPNETFFVNLSNATNGVNIRDASGTGTINDDD